MNDPQSFDYHHYADADEIGRRFGISDDGVARVVAWLDENGLDVVETFPQRTTMRVAGRAANIDRMLQVTLVDRLDPRSGQRYHRPQGTPRVPAALADVVEGVAGLDTRPVLRPVLGVAPRGAGTACSKRDSCLTPDKLARSFDITALHQHGTRGEGQYVAVIMDGPVSDADLRQFQTTGGLVGVPPIERITVGSGPSASESGKPISRAEATMDVETVQAVAPRANILYFYASLGAFGDAVNAVLRDGRAKVITFSAGGCDDGTTVNIPDERALQAANAAGVNVFASSGDHGAFNCLAFDPNDFRPTASEPSDSSLVISVGATFLERMPDGTYIDESAWVEPLDNWGTGGALNPSAAPAELAGRPRRDQPLLRRQATEPDVSAPGDPESGWMIVVGGEEQRAGGTSASSPFWAGVTSPTRYGQRLSVHSATCCSSRMSRREQPSCCRKAWTSFDACKTNGGLPTPFAGWVSSCITVARSYKELRWVRRVSHSRGIGDSKGSAYALNLLGGARLSCGEYDRAYQLYKESLALFRAMGNMWASAANLHFLGMTQLALGAITEARSLAEESLALLHRFKTPYLMVEVLTVYAFEATALGEESRANVLMEEAQALARQTGNMEDLAPMCWGVEHLALRQGNLAVAHQKCTYNV